MASVARPTVCPIPCWCSYCYDNTLKQEDDYSDEYQRHQEEDYPFTPVDIPLIPVPLASPILDQHDNLFIDSNHSSNLLDTPQSVPDPTSTTTPENIQQHTPVVPDYTQEPLQESVQTIDGPPLSQIAASSSSPSHAPVHIRVVSRPSHAQTAPPPPAPFNRRVNLQETPWQLMPLPGGHCPGRIARYTLTIHVGGLALLELQTWSGIYSVYRFWLRNLAMTQVELDTKYMPCTLLVMRRGSPIKILFETLEEANVCHEYLFDAVER